MNKPVRHFYEFGRFRVDVSERRLLRDGEPVPLPPKIFATLMALVENSGHLLTRDELHKTIWTDTYVEDNNLTQYVSALRKIFGGEQIIENVPRVGYRFAANVREIWEDPEPLLIEYRERQRLTIVHEEATDILGKRGKSLSRISIGVAVLFGGILILGLAGMLNRTNKNEPRAVVAENQSARGTNNAEAFDLYQKGRALWQNRSVEGLYQATSNFEQAIGRDPSFALAHAALADAYAFDINLWVKAEAAANEAIRLDPGLGEPHATIGFVRTFWEWKLREAEPYFKQAIALSPDYATAHQWYAINLAARAKGGDALAEMKRALELEPDSLAINADMCQVLYFSRKYDQAIEQCQKTLDMDPNFLHAHSYLYDVYTAKEMYPEAVSEYFKMEELNMTSLASPAQLEKVRRAYATGGIRSFWRARIEMMKKPIPSLGYPIARYHARLGESDEAFRWFRRAYENRDFGFVFFIADPAHVGLLTEPQYLELAALLLDRNVKVD